MYIFLFKFDNLLILSKDIVKFVIGNGRIFLTFNLLDIKESVFLSIINVEFQKIQIIQSL